MLVFALPLVVVFSLCYAATRHEEMGLILPHAARFGGWLAFFLFVAMGIMELLSWVKH